MRALLAGFITLVLTSFAALATTTAPGGTAGATPGATTGGGIGDYSWLIILLILVAVAIWYFMRGRNRTSL